MSGKHCPVIVSRQIGIYSMKRSEIRVEVPADCRLVGIRTDGDVAVIIYEPIQSVRQIGFIHYPEPNDENEDEPDNKK